jgi:hypothetical protein
VLTAINLACLATITSETIITNRPFLIFMKPDILCGSRLRSAGTDQVSQIFCDLSVQTNFVTNRVFVFGDHNPYLEILLLF